LRLHRSPVKIDGTGAVGVLNLNFPTCS